MPRCCCGIQIFLNGLISFVLKQLHLVASRFFPDSSIDYVQGDLDVGLQTLLCCREAAMSLAHQVHSRDSERVLVLSLLAWSSLTRAVTRLKPTLIQLIRIAHEITNPEPEREYRFRDLANLHRQQTELFMSFKSKTVGLGTELTRLEKEVASVRKKRALKRWLFFGTVSLVRPPTLLTGSFTPTTEDHSPPTRRLDARSLSMAELPVVHTVLVPQSARRQGAAVSPAPAAAPGGPPDPNAHLNILDLVVPQATARLRVTPTPSPTPDHPAAVSLNSTTTSCFALIADAIGARAQRWAYQTLGWRIIAPTRDLSVRFSNHKPFRLFYV
ncbi:hypothetical protein PAPYR_7769 [Paratrimastix pyriformis]|uniref:Uncharacterized protein n=1 Tax=Paratrimastix pyriformis TaxID=342808 RepID=A0ABQ8UGM1_9EUKA|nr:hypothetical protein PAPYR_7769 [Paratrimastix pyriformis]